MSEQIRPSMTGVPEFAGLHRELEIGMQLAPTRSAAPSAAKSLAALMDAEPAVPVRIAALGASDSRVLITIAVTLGAVDAIKVAAPESRAALGLLQRIVDDLAGYDPAFVALPHPTSAEARLAAHVSRHPEALSMLGAVRVLARN
jgi:hypothetical protein